MQYLTVLIVRVFSRPSWNGLRSSSGQLKLWSFCWLACAWKTRICSVLLKWKQGFFRRQQRGHDKQQKKKQIAANRLQGSDGWVQTWELLFWIKRFNVIFVDLSLIFGFLKFRVKGLTLFLNIFFTEIGFNFRVLLRQPRLAEHLLQASTAHATGPWAAGHRCGAPPHLQRLFATGAPYVKHI